MTERLRRQGLVDESGQPIPSQFRRLASVLNGMDPDSVRTMLEHCLGFENRAPAGTHTTAAGRIWNNDNGGSEIWRYRDPDSNSNIYVRNDQYGHEDAAERGWVGGRSHYHVDELPDRDASASPVRERFRDDEAAAGTRMNDDYVPLDDQGQPLTREQNYEQRFEEAAIPLNQEGDRANGPQESHHLYPNPPLESLYE